MTVARHPGETELLRWFETGHLPGDISGISALFGDLARDLVHVLPSHPELTVALRRLLEAKDCAVRAAIAARPTKGD